MFDILAASYMSASRMDHFLEQDFMHRDPEIVRRLRRAHGLDSEYPEEVRRQRLLAAKAPTRPSRHLIRRGLWTAAGGVGHALRRLGEWMEKAASDSFATQLTPCGSGPTRTTHL